MRIIDCEQQSEEWDRWRRRPTASEFGKFCTPAKGDYSSQAIKYAAKILSKQRGMYTEPPPTYWMVWGTEQEPNAKLAYAKQTGHVIQNAGFVLPDNTDAYGCSPDLLVDDEGMAQIKCPSPETLYAYHDAGIFPIEHRPQVQGELFITGRKWSDFYAFHPGLKPFLITVEPDEQYQAKIAANLLLLLRDIKRLGLLVPTMRHELVSVTQSDVRFDDE
jgi:hypothetical protein